ncbi:hypothetical protein HY636_01015 [Candidatus Woesearchaeota archaeon]|nr:hypothetical protein [Candidatus Woesearchaeota archaeon]
MKSLLGNLNKNFKRSMRRDLGKSLLPALFLSSILIIIFLNPILSYATAIGISPAKIYLNESVNKTITLMNPNNETVLFTLTSMNGAVAFNKINGKIKADVKESITVLINPQKSFEKGVYDDIILVTAFQNKDIFQNKGANFKNSIGIKAVLNVTKDINATDYYFYDEFSNETIEKQIDNSIDNNIKDNERNQTIKPPNLITGMAVFYDSKIKDNNWINLIVVIIFIVALYFFVKEKKDNEKNDNQKKDDKEQRGIKYEF